jgi:hypothetical protein
LKGRRTSRRETTKGNAQSCCWVSVDSSDRIEKSRESLRTRTRQ